MTATTTLQPTSVTSDAKPLTRGKLRELWSDSMVYAGRNVAHIRQIPEKLLDVTVQPIMFTLLFAFVFGGAITMAGGGNYREYLVGGILIQSLTFGMMGPGTSMANDLTEGVVDRFRSLPASRTAYLIGHYVAELGGLALSIVILLSAGLVVGWRVHSSVAEFVLCIIMLLLYASAMVWVGTVIGLFVRSADAVMGVGFTIVFPITFISNTFVPIATMPEALQVFAAWNPVSALVAATRELFGNPTTPLTRSSWPLEHPVPASFIYCAIILAIAVPLALYRYRSKTTD